MAHLDQFNTASTQFDKRNSWPKKNKKPEHILGDGWRLEHVVDLNMKTECCLFL